MVICFRVIRTTWRNYCVFRFNAVYDEYRRSPKVTKERIYLETMDEIFGAENKPVLIDSELENLVPVKNLKD